MFLHEKNKTLTVTINSAFTYINDDLSINYTHMQSYVNSIHRSEFKVKDIPDFSACPSYLDILLKNSQWETESTIS